MGSYPDATEFNSLRAHHFFPALILVDQSGLSQLVDSLFTFAASLPFVTQSYAGGRELSLPVTCAKVRRLPMIAREASSNLWPSVSLRLLNLNDCSSR